MSARTVTVLCLLALVLGCDRGGDAVAPKARETWVTNVVTQTRELVVTNVVTVTKTVTNVIAVRPAEPVLSARKTSPYRLFSDSLDETQLRKVASDFGMRVLTCERGSIALVEAQTNAAASARAAVGVQALGADDKLSPDVGEDVRLVPMSFIDCAAVAEAVRAAGGEVVQVVTEQKPSVRAKVPFSQIRKLAGRGDVRRIERDRK